MFYNAKFPENMSIFFEKSINFNTEINKTKNFTEQRITLNNDCYNTYTLNYNNLTHYNLEEIVSFFNIVKGRYSTFRFKDWSDYKVINQLIDSYNGLNNFQLKKTYSINLLDNTQVFYTKNITKPVKDKVKIYINSIETTNFTMDYNTGIFNINNTLSENDIISADFEFDINVRFFSDELRIVNKTKNISEIKDLKLIEVL